jgi:hypothetical protein
MDDRRRKETEEVGRDLRRRNEEVGEARVVGQETVENGSDGGVEGTELVDGWAVNMRDQKGRRRDGAERTNFETKRMFFIVLVECESAVVVL